MPLEAFLALAGSFREAQLCRTPLSNPTLPFFLVGLGRCETASPRLGCPPGLYGLVTSAPPTPSRLTSIPWQAEQTWGREVGCEGPQQVKCWQVGERDVATANAQTESLRPNPSSATRTSDLTSQSPDLGAVR